MENVFQAMQGINDPKLSFTNELEMTASAMQDLSPDMLRTALRCLLFVGAHIAIDKPTALADTTNMMAGAFALGKDEREQYFNQLANVFFAGEEKK